MGAFGRTRHAAGTLPPPGLAAVAAQAGTGALPGDEQAGWQRPGAAFAGLGPRQMLPEDQVSVLDFGGRGVDGLGFDGPPDAPDRVARDDAMCAAARDMYGLLPLGFVVGTTAGAEDLGPPGLGCSVETLERDRAAAAAAGGTAEESAPQ